MRHQLYCARKLRYRYIERNDKILMKTWDRKDDGIEALFDMDFSPMIYEWITYLANVNWRTTERYFTIRTNLTHIAASRLTQRNGR